MKNFFQATIIFFSLIVSHSALALDPVYTGFFSNTAIKGYDTVAYFTENKPVKGSSDFQTEYNGAKWLFSSQKNLDLFIANPDQYAPQYGGYCAWAVAKNQTASIKPHLFTIVNDKLYLNYNEKINNQWNEIKFEAIKLGDENWPKLLAE